MIYPFLADLLDRPVTLALVADSIINCTAEQINDDNQRAASTDIESR